MRKLTIHNGQLKIIIAIIVFTFSILNSPFSISTALAVDSTPSADIKTKLEELKKEIASKAAKLKQEVNRKLKDKAYIGKVKVKSESTITLATKNGPKLVNINQDTQFEGSKGKKYSYKTVAQEDYLVSLGDVDETGVLTAKKVILLPAPNSTLKTFLWGQNISISDKLITLKDQKSKSIAVSISNPSVIKVLDFTILTGYFGKNDIFQAEFVHVIPQGGIIKPKKTRLPDGQVATPSAQPSKKPVQSASPSATPKLSPKPVAR